MATGFNTQTGGGEYRLQFETDNKEYLLMMQEAARWCVDKKPADGFTSGVRCGECKYWGFTRGGEGDLLIGDCNHPRLAIPGTVAPTMCAHEFCALGEREEV